MCWALHAGCIHVFYYLLIRENVWFFYMMKTNSGRMLSVNFRSSPNVQDIRWSVLLLECHLMLFWANKHVAVGEWGDHVLKHSYRKSVLIRLSYKSCVFLPVEALVWALGWLMCVDSFILILHCSPFFFFLFRQSNQFKLCIGEVHCFLSSAQTLSQHCRQCRPWKRGSIKSSSTKLHGIKENLLFI